MKTGLSLTRQTLLGAVDELCGKDRQLEQVVDRVGTPPLWARRPGFRTLVLIILEQQVSLASARATFARLQKAAGPITPGRITSMSQGELRDLGVTRQKSAYIYDLAHLIETGDVDLGGMSRRSDQQVRESMLDIRGVGPWTAGIYLMMALRRPDIWPPGDIALAESMRKIKNLKTRPGTQRQLHIANSWRPWRSVAARILWHAYLCDKGSRHPITP